MTDDIEIGEVRQRPSCPTPTVVAVIAMDRTHVIVKSGRRQYTLTREEFASRFPKGDA